MTSVPGNDSPTGQLGGACSHFGIPIGVAPQDVRRHPKSQTKSQPPPGTGRAGSRPAIIAAGRCRGNGRVLRCPADSEIGKLIEAITKIIKT